MSKFGWAIVGPGKIAHRFADAVSQLPDARLAGVNGRDPDRADAFACAWPGQDGSAMPVFADLESMLRSDSVDGVYIATPHAFHADTVRRCLLAGKPVLCEKSLVPNATLASELIALSQRQGVFLMEAIWTRFLPVYAEVGEWLSSGAIGKIRGVQSSFCFMVPFDPTTRLFDPAQAGGSLLDIGIYNLTVTQWVLRMALGSCPELESIIATGVLGPTGVDHRVVATLDFSGGVSSQFQCGFDSMSDNALHIFGEQGVITLPTKFWQATTATLQTSDLAPETIERPFRINGFEGEIEEAMRCIRRGEIESPVVPHSDTLATVEWMDRIRAQLGVKYPFE